MRRRITEIEVNGEIRPVDEDPGRHLLWVLRDMGLHGTHYGCGEGQCGFCTVLVDGEPRRSCTTSLSEVGTRPVLTIEGLSNGDALHPVQQAFLDEQALQCGYCTSGMIMSAVALLERTPNPTDREIVNHMDGNICRCGVYRRVIAAVRRASRRDEAG